MSENIGKKDIDISPPVGVIMEVDLYKFCFDNNLSSKVKPFLKRLRMAGGFMYLVAIIDWYSRYIVSWELSTSLERSFVLRALRRAIA